jgi:hypothetical protein
MSAEATMQYEEHDPMDQQQQQQHVEGGGQEEMEVRTLACLTLSPIFVNPLWIKFRSTHQDSNENGRRIP